MYCLPCCSRAIGACHIALVTDKILEGFVVRNSFSECMDKDVDLWIIEITAMQ